MKGELASRLAGRLGAVQACATTTERLRGALRCAAAQLGCVQVRLTGWRQDTPRQSKGWGGPVGGGVSGGREANSAKRSPTA